MLTIFTWRAGFPGDINSCPTATTLFLSRCVASGTRLGYEKSPPYLRDMDWPAIVRAFFLSDISASDIDLRRDYSRRKPFILRMASPALWLSKVSCIRFKSAMYARGGSVGTSCAAALLASSQVALRLTRFDGQICI
jgi:hypothetical protein